MASNIEVRAKQKISELLNNIYQKLSKSPFLSDQQRQLMPAEEEIMQNLDKQGFLYQSLLRVLAIDSYSSNILNQLSLQDQLSGMMAATLQNFNELGDSMKKISQKRQIVQKYNASVDYLIQSIKILQELFPKNTFIEEQNNLIQQRAVNTKIDHTLMAKLRNENQELAKKAELNQIQILNMESKLTKLLKQHQGCQRNYSLGNKLSSIQLREQLLLKQTEIERMNQQFSVQIQKYNVVFQAMKRELQDMKGYQNIDLIEQIQLLETEIVRLREERDRDQIIIRQLRNDNTMFSSSSMGYNSPRQSYRYQSSRYQY